MNRPKVRLIGVLPACWIWKKSVPRPMLLMRRRMYTVPDPPGSVVT